jgi:hypothetical protein
MSRLILFAGSSPGAGKTTLSALLAEALTQAGRPAIWLSEEEIGDALARFEPSLATETIAIDPFPRAAAAFARSYRDAAATIIVDSWLPPVYFLAGRYPAEQIVRSGIDLYESLQPLDPLLIDVRCDVRIALRRAVAQRGAAWLDTVRSYMNSWTLPYFSAESRPFPDHAALVRFFSEAAALTRRIVEAWPGETLVLDATATPLDQLARTLLDHFGLAPTTTTHVVPARRLESYAGSYVAHESSSDPQRITVRFDGSQLIIDAYWPGGTLLLPRDDSRFRLEATNRWIVFDPPRDGPSTGLTYIVRGAEHRYARATETT